MAVTVTAVSASGNWEADGSIVADLPVNTAGQLLLCGTFARLAAQTINLPSASPGAWTLASGDNLTGAFTTGEIAAKTAGGSETAPTLSSSVATTQGTGGIILAISGWSGTLGDILSGSTGSSGSTATIICPAVANAPDGSLVVRWYFNADANAISNDTGAGGVQVFTQLITPGLGRLGLHVYAGTQVGAGSTGTASLVVAGSDGWLAITTVIPPLVSGSPTNAAAAAAAATAAVAANPGVSPTAGSLASASALNASPLIGAAANHATAVAAALQPSLSVAVLAECATATGSAYNAVFAIPSSPAGPRIVSTSARGRITTSTPPRITTTSPRGLL